MHKYIVILTLLLNYVISQSNFDEKKLQKDSLKHIENSYKLYSLYQKSDLSTTYKIDQKALKPNYYNFDPTLNLNQFYYFNPLMHDWMKIRSKVYRYKYEKIDENGYEPETSFNPYY